MIIIADGGSTKTNWCLLNESGRKIYFNTEGYNPFFATTDYIISSLRNNLPGHLALDQIREVNYYGAGCSSEANVNIVKEAMNTIFPAARVSVGHDLLAACRALLGLNQGFAAILGTGTNTCLYDGQKVSLNIDSLGYFLGDEGSGAYIGKRILRDYMRGYMPKKLQSLFTDTYKLSHADIFDHLYNQPLPNRFCASFSKFIYDHTDNPEYTRKVVDDSFTDFFNSLVIHYPEYKKYHLNCVGSFGYSFRDILSEVANRFEMGIGKIIRSPIDDLVHYHMVLSRLEK
jgi:N-acetylglucosamine kinase-like BadF-type ATPase